MLEFKKTGREEVAKQDSKKVAGEIKRYQKMIDDEIKKHLPGEKIRKTLREMEGKKIKPAEGKRFREYVRTGKLKGIKDLGTLSNGSVQYELSKELKTIDEEIPKLTFSRKKQLKETKKEKIRKIS